MRFLLKWLLRSHDRRPKVLIGALIASCCLLHPNSSGGEPIARDSDSQSATSAPQSPAGIIPATAYGNPQRSAVFSTKGLDEMPQRALWQSVKLFDFRLQDSVVVEVGPASLQFDVPTFERVSIPIVSNGIIFFTFHDKNAFLFAIDTLTGNKLRVLKLEQNTVSALAAIGGTVYFGGLAGVHAFDVRKNTERWVFTRTGLWFSYASPVIDDGIIYMFGGGEGSGLYALDADTGALKWTFNSTEFLYGPAIAGDALVLVNPKGSILALDKRSGMKKWETKVDVGPFAPAILDDQILLPFKNGEVRAYGLDDGALRWKSKKDGGARTALALFKGKVIYGGHDDSIIALEARTGQTAWKFRTSLHCHSPIVAGDLLYAVCQDRTLYAIDPPTGSVKWRLKNKEGVPAPPAFADGVMYSLGLDGFLSAWK